jgi:hypothetical protein
VKPTNDRALKEWAVVVRSLEAGDTILLLRKGGIVEAGGAFRLDDPEFYLFPNHTHQNTAQLQPRAHALLEATEADRPDEGTVRISSYAEVAKVWIVPDAATIARLDDEHLWSRDYIVERLHYKSDDPLYAIALRVYRLPQPAVIPYSRAYGGCTSWVTLVEPLSIAGAVPALNDPAFEAHLNTIGTLLEKP